MIRGTTAQFRFKLPCKKGDLGWATIKFWQPGNSGIGGSLPITKRLEDCAPMPNDSEELCVSLTPRDTMKFSDKYKARVQLRALKKTEDGEAVFASHVQLITVYPINDEILNDDHLTDVDSDSDWIILDGQQVVDK